MAKLVVFISLLIASSCTHHRVSTDHFPKRTPQSTREFIDGTSQILEQVSSPQIFNARSCSSYIDRVSKQLFELPTKFFAPETASEVSELKSRGPEVLQTLFRTRVKLRERLREFHDENAASPDCVKATREGFRYLRFAEETLIEWLQNHGVFNKETPPPLAGGAPHTLINPAFEGQVDFQPGDLMLVRGKSHVSAMIARIGDEEAQFSHLAMIGQDAKGKLYAMEALIETGSILTPLEKWREDRDARMVLYRHPDRELARKAARAIYDKIAPPFHAKKNIRYDFGMDDNDSTTLFCAEVISYAYKMASGGRFKVPLHRTGVEKFKGTDYLQAMGIKGPSFFAPADIEVDVRFDMVAEFRHWPLLRQVRMQDSVLTSIYGWMIERGYRFSNTVTHAGKANLAKLLRNFGLLKEKIPTYMPVNSIKVTLQFETVAVALQENIYAKEAEYFKTHGHSMTFKEMLAINEELRRDDCEKHRQALNENGGDQSKFHWFYAPRKRMDCGL